ncbi:MAG: LemA family protein [Patescibacteria group bacterium]
MTPLIIVAVLVGAVVLYFVSIYNGLAVAKQKIKEAFADIDTQLKKRFDLIPNIVETVKGYASHESKIFEDIAKYRAASVGGGTIEERAEASNALSGALKSLFAVAENYPDLKANTNFLDLQKTLNQVESDIQNSRRYYNGSVREFNNRVIVFPTNLVANMMGFTEEKYFESKEEERQNVQVKF